MNLDSFNCVFGRVRHNRHIDRADTADTKLTISHKNQNATVLRTANSTTDVSSVLKKFA